MGVIVDQSIKGSVFSYIGAGLGFVNTALLFPAFFATNQIGLIFLLLSVSMIFAQFFSLGFNGVITRLFPYFNDKENGHNGFPFLMISTTTVGIVMFVVVYFLIRSLIIEHNSHSLEFIQNVDLIIPITIAEIFFRLFNSYTSVLLNSVIGTFYKEFILRIIITLLIVLFILELVNYELFVYLYIAAQSVPAIALLIYLLKEKELNLKPKISFITIDLRASMVFTAIVSLVTGLGAVGYQYIDKYMINTMLDLSNTGVYTIAFFFGSMVALPARALKKISSVIIAKAWKKGDLEEIRAIYTKSSIVQTVIGLYVFVGIMINIDDVILILGEEYIESKLVIFFVGLSFLFDLIFGVSSQIIMFGNYYRFFAYFMFVFVSVVVITNYFLIPIWGISGAALASSVSMLIFTIIKYLFLKLKFNLQPFSMKHLIQISVAVVLFWGFYYMPSIVINPYIAIIIKSIIFSLIFAYSSYKLKISEDINNKIDVTFTKVKQRFF